MGRLTFIEPLRFREGQEYKIKATNNAGRTVLAAGGDFIVEYTGQYKNGTMLFKLVYSSIRGIPPRGSSSEAIASFFGLPSCVTCEYKEDGLYISGLASDCYEHHQY